MIRHHPADDFLLDYAVGRLSTGHAIVAASHVEACPHCQERVRVLEATAGALMEGLPPAPMAADALARTLAAIDAIEAGPARAEPPAPPAARRRATLPGGLPWPRALDACDISRWYWIAPGMHFSRVSVPQDRAANLFLLRIGAGKLLAQHTHNGTELTQVLHGAFDDGREVFAAGDFDETDGDIHHQPTASAAGECICLASVEGKVLFDGVIARAIGTLIGM